MKYATIKKNDVVNGEGINVSLFVQGCPHKCTGCFNQEALDFNGGTEYTEETYLEILTALTKHNINRDFSVLGGEPLCKENFYEVINTIKKIKISLPDIKIYVWSGYTFQELLKMHNKEDLLNIDILIDGKFVESLKKYSLKLRGSSNQRIIDMKKSIKNNKIVLLKI